MPGNHQILVSGNYPHGAGTIRRGDDFRVGIVISWIEVYSKIIEAVADHHLTGAARSPIPPVNTRVSRPPRTADSDPIYLRAV